MTTAVEQFVETYQRLARIRDAPRARERDDFNWLAVRVFVVVVAVALVAIPATRPAAETFFYGVAAVMLIGGLAKLFWTGRI